MSYLKEETDLIIADSLRELNYKQKKLFLASLKESNAERETYAGALIKTFGAGVYNKLRDEFADEAYRQKVLAALEKKSVVCTTIKSANYPLQLKNIPAPPLVLYMRGNTELLKKDMFAVVGSRKTTAPVAAECKKICAALSERLAVVTGVADGADSYAAEGALKTGNVICVLPGGHDTSCAANAKILRRVEKEGLSVSEFAPGLPAQRYTFILRNRVIAGLCRGVLVVSAAKKSGALSTASYAADYSRDVFAFPYSIGIPSGEGCNALIKKGAFLCEEVNDILSALGYEMQKEESIEVSKDESVILNILKEQGELHAEKIALAAGKKLYEVTVTLSLLEIKGLIVRCAGNKYAAV